MKEERMKKEEEQNSRRTKWGWWLLKLWFGMLCASVLCNWCIVGVMSLFLKNFRVDNDGYIWLLLIFYGAMILALAIGAVTLFLNCSRRNRENEVCRFLSFFLMSLLLAGYIVRMYWSNWIDILVVLCPIYFAFFPCLTGAYILFLRKLKRA